WRARKESNPLWRGFGDRRSAGELHARYSSAPLFRHPAAAPRRAKKAPGEAEGSWDFSAPGSVQRSSVPAEQRSRAEVESIVHAGFDDMDLAVEVAAEIQHVVFDLGRPIVPEGIFGTDTKHPSADRLVTGNRDAHAVHADETIEADVGPGAAQLAVDEPAIE